MTPDWEVGRNSLNYFYGVESSCSNYIQVHELIQCLAATAADTAQCYTSAAGTKALPVTSPCLNTGHRCHLPGNLTQPFCSLPRAQFPSRHCLAATFSREKKRQKSILISLFTDLTRLFSKSLLTIVISLTRRWFVLWAHIIPRAKWNCFQVLVPLACKEKVWMLCPALLGSASTFPPRLQHLHQIHALLYSHQGLSFIPTT